MIFFGLAVLLVILTIPHILSRMRRERAKLAALEAEMREADKTRVALEVSQRAQQIERSMRIRAEVEKQRSQALQEMQRQADSAGGRFTRMSDRVDRARTAPRPSAGANPVVTPHPVVTPRLDAHGYRVPYDPPQTSQQTSFVEVPYVIGIPYETSTNRQAFEPAAETAAPEPTPTFGGGMSGGAGASDSWGSSSSSSSSGDGDGGDGSSSGDGGSGDGGDGGGDGN